MLYIVYIPMYVGICPSMIYILNSCHIGRTKLVLSLNLIFLLVRGALVETPVNWERRGMYYALVEPPQGHVVS